MPFSIRVRSFSHENLSYPNFVNDERIKQQEYNDIILY